MKKDTVRGNLGGFQKFFASNIKFTQICCKIIFLFTNNILLGRIVPQDNRIATHIRCTKGIRNLG